MEKSHQKVLMEMRRTHKRELDQLRVEKDQLLAEETKATQAGELTFITLDIFYLGTYLKIGFRDKQTNRVFPLIVV